MDASDDVVDPQTQQKNLICYGDYVYLSFQTEDKKERHLISCDGSFSPYVWSGGYESMKMKNYHGCLFQIFPNQYGERDQFFIEAENKFSMFSNYESK